MSIYVLQSEAEVMGHIADHSTIGYFTSIEVAILSLNKYADNKRNTYKSVKKYNDDTICGNVIIEAIDYNDVTVRLWLEKIELFAE